MGSIISGAVEGVTGKGAQEEAKKNSKSQRKIADLQSQLIRDNLPLIEQLRSQFGPMIGQIAGLSSKALDEANTYDPAQESERALLAFDTAAKDTLQSDLGEVNSGYTARGFNAGNGDSDQNGANQDVLARRAFNRGSFASQLKMSEADRKRAVQNNAFNTASNAFGMLDPTGRTTTSVGALSSPASSYGNLANLAQNRANGADPSGAINLISGGLKGIKWPWEKKKATEYGDSL